MKRIIQTTLFLLLAFLLPATAQNHVANGIRHLKHPLTSRAMPHNARAPQPKVMMSPNLTQQLTAPALKATPRSFEAERSLMQQAFNSAGNRLKNKPSRRLSADNLLGSKIFFSTKYKYDFETDEVIRCIDYQVGGGNVIFTEVSPGVFNFVKDIGFESYDDLYTFFLDPVTINVDYNAKTAEMVMGTIACHQWSDTVENNGVFYYDTIQYVIIANEDYIRNAPNGTPTNITGKIIDDGSIYFADGFCFYNTYYCTKRSSTSNLATHDTITIVSPIYRDTYLMTPNGKHDFCQQINYVSYDGDEWIYVPAYNNPLSKDVYMYQADDTTAVVWNLWGLGSPGMVMYIHEDGIMEFPSLQLVTSADWTEMQEVYPDMYFYNEYYNFSVDLDAEGDSVDIWTANTNSKFGTVTPTEICWDASVVISPVIVDSWGNIGFQSYFEPFLHNKLTFTDGSQWFEQPAADNLYYRYEENGEAIVIAGEVPYSGDIVIPETTVHDGRIYTVTAIDSIAFNNCTELTSVVIPNTITAIGSWAFRFCSSLTNIDIPNSVTTIGNYAFAGCKELTSVIIPNSITIINESVFRNCSKLESVTIGDAVTTISKNAFLNCEELTSVNIPSSVTTIGDVAFGRCFKMENVYITDLEAWCRINFLGFTANPCNHGGDYEKGTNLVLNGEIITDLVIPNSVTSIGDYAFMNCNSLTSVSVPNSVTSIGKEVFYGCINLANITIGDSVTSIGEYAFLACKSLTSFNIPNSIKVIENGLFSNCKNLTSIIVPNSIISIGDYAFNYCSSLTSIDIPNSVKEIGSNAFCMCTNLTSVTLPDSITTIRERLFFPCISLTSITIPDLVTSIEYQAFYNCNSMTSVIIGKSVTSIGKEAFDCCVALTDVTCLAETPPTIEDETTIPSYVTRQATLYVPAASLELYRQAEYWRDFANIEAITEVGDVNGDGTLNVSDVTLIINLLLNEGGQVDNPAADLNSDGNINVTDVVLLINMLLKES